MVQSSSTSQRTGRNRADASAAGVTSQVEAIRLPLEREVFAQLQALPGFDALRDAIGADAAAVRRHLLSSSVRLTEGMAPALHEAAQASMQRLGLGKPLEIYQRDGAENAAMHLVPEPVLLEVRGRLITLLDLGSTRALVGHELGHYLAHGPLSPLGPAALLANALTRASDVPEPLRLLGSKLSMAQELTADRFGLLACQSLDDALRLEMICTTGLPGSALSWDTEAYLSQCKELIEGYLRDGTSAQGLTHPEHSLRAYAAWLFSETSLYRDLTGKGPGSRSVDEVNALLRRCLGADSLGSGEHMLQAPPPEMHACALAACVLVAAADGEIADQEVEAIENVFAPLVPEASRYLEVSEAQRQFAQLAPIVAALGPGVHRSLFLLLVHIVAADGIIDERELTAVLRIGDALGARPLFERLLAVVLRHLAPATAGPLVTVRLDIDIPLPPRPGEGAEALGLYVRGVATRGGGETSLRRLCHLLGQQTSSPAALDTIERAFTSQGVRTEVPLGAVDDLDTVIRLLAEAPSAPPPSRAVATGPLHPRLVRALGTLRDRLVSGDGRSPSIRLYEARSGRAFDLKSLDRVSLGLAERTLVAVHSGARAQLVQAQEAGLHDGSSRVAAELLALLREHRARLEETGSNDLSLGYPFLTGQSGGYLVRGPLVLFPVELTIQEAGARGFSLRSAPDSPPVVNLPLLRVLFGKRNLALPDSLVTEFDTLVQDPLQASTAILTRLEQLGLVAGHLTGSLQPLSDPRPRSETWTRDQLEVEECAVLGLFPLSSSDLLQDYDELIDQLNKGASPGPLLGAAAALLPAELREQVGFTGIEARSDTTRLVPLIAADPTQHDVLRKARATRGLVVDGPPGTGKSQVIVNLVADALGRGERVAVVSEKRAALDVVAQRLERAGLLRAAALVHDVQEDRKPLYTRLAARLEAAAPATPLPDRTAGADHEVQQASAPLASRASLLSVRAGSDGPTVGQLLSLRSGLPVASLPGTMAPLAAVPFASVRPLAQAMAELAPFASLFRAGSPWAHPRRGSLAGWGPAHVSALVAGLRAAATTAARLAVARHEAGGAEVAALAAVRDCIQAALATRSLRSTIDDQALFAHLLGRLQSGASLDPLLDIERQTSMHQAALATVPRRPGTVLEEAISAQVTQLIVWLGRWWRWLSPSFWRAKAAVQEAAVRLFPERPQGKIDATLAREVLVTSHVARVLQGIDALLGQYGLLHLTPRVPADVMSLSTRLSTLTRLLTPLMATQPQLRALGLWPDEPSIEALDRWDRRLDGAQRTLEAIAAHEATLAPCQQTLPWLAPSTPEGELILLGTALSLDGSRLVEADTRLATARGIASGALDLLTHLTAALPAGTAEGWRQTLVASWADGVLARERSALPDLARLGHAPALRELPGLEARLAAAGEGAREAERQRVLAKLEDVALLQAPTPDKGKRRTDTQAVREAMLKETKKQRNVLPLRSFVRQFSSKGLLELLPVWLLSPETMTVLFPREPLFDLVIFDEASQCTVESGLPALLRARRFVVAGDEKQMPPSSFFKASADTANDESDEAAHEAAEDLEAESLLALARQRVPASPLTWHYRCLSEELIAFSNHALYAGDLRTIPSTASRAAPSVVRWVTVPDGVNEGGENRPEARRVVDELSQLLQPPTAGGAPPSVGVVTMNVTQRKAILDEIDVRRQSDRAFAEAWDRASAAERLDERPFVKNIENVQGDERDIIVFSLGYAPVERRTKKGVDRTVPARFGPLGQRGGERRLNVAISRAKRACLVVASFEPSMLSVARTQHPGPKLFKQFLEYAFHQASGQRSLADKVLSLAGSSAPTTRTAATALPLADHVPLRVQLALALGERGLTCELDVGDSTFRVPLAIVSPTDSSRYVLAVLCDEGDEPLAPDERHVHRPSVLRSRGWQTLSVSSADWAQDRAAVLNTIVQLAGVPLAPDPSFPSQDLRATS